MDNKTNDWFAARFLNVDKPVEVLLNEGINTENSNLQEKDFYKNKNKVQNAFKKDDGSFDEDAFDKFYDNIASEYSYLSSIDTENYILNAYEKSESNFSTNFGNVIDSEINVERIANPQDQSFGLINPNEWSTPTKSKREAAQNNQYFDNETGKWSNETVNEAGISGLLTGKSLVYATWDEDGTHIDPFTKKEVEHKKGDWKTDEFGNYYAETTDNEENIDKQFVTWSEVLTDDESPWNKIDIFDSDDLNSNIARTLLKGTAIVGATLISPKLGQSLFYTTASVNLARVLPQVSKSIAAFFGAEDFDTLNKWDNNMRRFGQSSSDYSQEHFFSLENILDMAIDSYMQLGTQRAIAKIPQKLGIGKNASQQMAVAETMQRIKTAQAGNVSQEVIEALTKSTEAYRTASKVFNNASKISNAVSKGYLIATSVEDSYNIAKSYGFDSQTAGLISLATYAGVGALFQTDYFRAILYNTPDYEISRDIKLLTKQWLKNSSETIKKDLSHVTSDVVKKSKLKSWGNSLIKHIQNHISDVQSGRFGIISGAINEGAEEVSEEIVQDLSFQIGKSWQSLKELFTGKEYNNEYSYIDSDPLARYGMSLFGGALGGAIFKLSDRLQLQKNAYKQWKEIIGGDNSQIMKELIYHVSQGRTNMILKEIDKLEQSPILSTSISAFTGQPTANTNESQNSVVFNMFKKAITDIDSFLTNNNLAIDYDKFGDVELIKGVRAAWLTSMANDGKGIQNSLFEDYQKRIVEIVNLQSEIQSVESKLSDNAKQEDIDAANTEKSKLKQVLDFKIDQIKKLVSGQDDSYLGRLMLESNKDILDKIAPITKDGISQYLYGLNYDELPTIYKSEVDKQINNNTNSGLTEINYISAWNIYKNISNDESIKNEFSNIESIAKNYTTLDNLSEGDVKDFLIAKEIFKTIQPYWNERQVLNLFYKTRGINSASLDFEGDGMIDNVLNIDHSLSLIDSVYNSWKSKYTVAESKLEDNPSIASEWLKDYLSGTNSKLTNQEGFALLTHDISKDHIHKLITDMYNSLETNPITDDLELQGTEQISSSIIDNLISKIIAKVDDKNTIDLILQQHDLLKLDSSKYFLSDSIHNALNQLNKLLDLVKSISDGSDSNRHVEIADIPFGANNYLNKAFADKGVKIELSQIATNTANAIKARINYLKAIINLLIETDLKNQGAVITTEKKIGIKYTEWKLQVIAKLLNDPKSQNILQILKDDLQNLDVSIKDLNSLTTDEEYIDLASKYRTNILKFERAFSNYWSSLDDLNKHELINTIKTIFNKDLYYDTSALNTNILKENGELLNNATAFMYLMTCSFGYSDLVTNTYKEYIKNSDKFPFDSQEDIVLTISKFLLNKSKSDVKLWIDAIISDEQTTENDFIKLYRSLKVVCSGGTGKTDVILPTLFNIISQVMPDKNVIFAANTNNQLLGIQKNIANANTTLISEIINNSTDKDSFKNNYGNSIIIIDECTNISKEELKSLDLLAEEYNIDFIYLGDTKQHSKGFSIDGAICPMTIQLTDSKRLLTDVARNNNEIFESLFKQDNTGRPQLNPLILPKFRYWEDQTRLEGIKFENNGDLSNKAIIEFYERYSLDPNTKVLIFSDNLTKFDLGALSQRYNLTFSNEIADIQGAEWDYVLTDIDLTLNGNLNNADFLEVYNKLKDIYTLFTRHKHGLISYKPLILKDLTENTRGTYIADIENNDLSLYEPVESGILGNKEALSKFIDYKLEILDNTETNENETYQEDKIDGIPSQIEQSKRPENVSLAQVAVGFLLSENFDDAFIKSLGLTRDEYSVVRNTLYLMITNKKNSEVLRNSLPDNLKNGRFLIKVRYSEEGELYNLGNLHRDDKSLRGRHPWIVYHIDDENGKDIYLGMFHNADTSIIANSEKSHTSEIINSLGSDVIKDGPAKYYEIPEKLFISRSSNILDIQNRETDLGTFIGLTYSNGKIVGSSINGETKQLDIIESTLSIYFRRGNENIVKVNDILDKLNNLRGLYQKVYDLCITKGLYSQDNVENIKELLKYDRVNNKWIVRSVPDLKDKFVVFARLKSNDKIQSSINFLQVCSNSYLKSLQEKSSQLNKIITILESEASENYKKQQIEQILSNRILLTTMPIAFDPDIINDEATFIDAIDNLTSDTYQGDQRSRKAYNDAVTHQLGYALRKIATLIRYHELLKLSDKNNKWFNKEDLKFIQRIWNKHKDGLIRAYSQWQGDSNFNNEESLITFLTENFTKANNGSNSKMIRVFDNKNGNLLQTTEFEKFLTELYFDKKWPYYVKKLNTLAWFKLSEDATKQIAGMLDGYMFPNLIKDNGINIITRGDELNIQNNSTFNIKSKIIQQGRIFVYGDDTLDLEDFKEYNNNTIESIEEPPFEEAVVISDTIDNTSKDSNESNGNNILVFSESKFIEDLNDIYTDTNNHNALKIKAKPRKELARHISAIYKKDPNVGSKLQELIIELVKDSNFESFESKIGELYNNLSKDMQNMLDGVKTLCDNYKPPLC